MTSSGDAPTFDPDDAANRDFTRARKGYDPTEVRAHLGQLAAEIRRLRSVEADLRAKVSQQSAAPPDAVSLDPATLSRVLGEETVRILDTAREASEEIRAKAEENAGRVVRDAHERANRLTRDATELRENAAREADEVTQSAAAAADAARAAAGEESDALLASARAEADVVRETAEQLLAERTAEAEAEAARIIGEAAAVRTDAEEEAARLLETIEAEAEERRAAAEAEAAQVIEDAREQGREMIREAKDARERMIRDLAERRHASRQQLEALRAGREQLIEAFGTARAAIDDVTDGLVDSLPAARSAADAAARGVRDDLDRSVAELDELIAAGASTDELIDGPSDSTPESGVQNDGEIAEGAEVHELHELHELVGRDTADDSPEDGADEGDHEADADDDTVIATLDGVAELDDTADDADEGDDERDAIDPAADGPTLVSIDGHVSETQVDDLRDDLDEDDDLDDDDDEDDDEDDDLDDDEHLELDGVAASSAEPQPGRLRLVASNTGDPSPVGLDALVEAKPDPPVVADAGEHSAEVEQLFARLRADRSALDDDDDLDDLDDDDVDDEDDFDDDDLDVEDEADGPGAVVIDLSIVEASAEDPAAVAGTRSAEAVEPLDLPVSLDEAAAQQAMLDERDVLISQVSQGLTRRIRRIVTDQENEVLDLVRRQKRIKGSDGVIPALDEQITVYRAVVETDLRQIVRAGSDFGAMGALAADDMDATVDELMATLVEWGIDPLRSRLARVVDDSDDATPDHVELADQLRATYREWRNDRIAELAGDLATRAFSSGVLAAAGPGQHVCWLVDHGGLPCPDGEDNQLAGPIPVGQPFPTGDVCPPAHPGCRCLLVPVSQ